MSRIHLAAAALFSLLPVMPATAQQPAQFVVQIWSFGFAPRPIHLAAGQPVTLTFVNRSGSSHDFTAPAFFGRSAISAGTVDNGEIELRPHETKSVTLTPARGIYAAHCSHFLHKQMGMSDQIVVD